MLSQSWSLRVELVFYVLMLFLVRNRIVVLLWFVGSLFYVIYLDHTAASFVERYATVLGASIAFSAGALIYFCLQRYRLPFWNLPIATVLYLLHLIFAGKIWSFDFSDFANTFRPGSFGLYGNLLLGAYLLYAILSIESDAKSNSGFAQTLGDIAYAVFLSHWMIALVLVGAGIEFSDRVMFVAIHFVVVNIVSLMIYIAIERPMNIKFRSRIRPTGGLKPIHIGANALLPDTGRLAMAQVSAVDQHEPPLN